MKQRPVKTPSLDDVLEVDIDVWIEDCHAADIGNSFEPAQLDFDEE